MKWALLALIISMGGDVVKRIIDDGRFWLVNYGDHAEYCWVELDNGRRSEVFLPPNSSSRWWWVEDIAAWGCY
jgi:hypothetical protein